ncbi:HAD family hydrolase [Longibacter salinarum]|uniref:phosphoglycolate phosphatase n=1 Tax=Longibacter salinarum TaxID=1850348 RepID=A0A2A8CZ74_9BACT|nr:HAD hydrolase-like protein [Longibacter salinarum]PEN13985.1 HAD family hydrolase [Longibacter salinarum]
MEKLLLFDIDGTLVRTNGSTRNAVERALAELVGRPLDTGAIRFSGKTDLQIMAEVFDANGVDADETLIREALDVYVSIAEPGLMSSDVDVLPGVRPLLDHLHDRSDIHLGLVTGNVEPMAYRKLDVVELATYFSFGAFGCDNANRNCLPALAIDRAHQHTGIRFEQTCVTVIGDTRRDIECSRAAGARAVAVCTGHASRQDLSSHGPDAILDNLSALDDVLRALDVPTSTQHLRSTVEPSPPERP